MIIKNNKTTSSIFKGSQAIDKVMKGTLVVYEAFKELIASGVPPLTLTKCKNANLIDYIIYGSSELVGDKTKNFIPYPYQYNTGTIDGITFTDNGDGTITANGTAGANAVYYCFQWSKADIPAGTYHFRGQPLNYTDENGNRIANVGFALRKDGVKILDTGDYGKGQTFTIDGADQIYMALRINAGMTVENMVFKPQLESGNKSTDFEPYGYKIPIKVNDNITNIYLKEPLKENEYMSYKNNDLPSILLNKGTNIIDIDTTIKPSNIEIEYLGKE